MSLANLFGSKSDPAYGTISRDQSWRPRKSPREAYENAQSFLNGRLLTFETMLGSRGDLKWIEMGELTAPLSAKDAFDFWLKVDEKLVQDYSSVHTPPKPSIAALEKAEKIFPEAALLQDAKAARNAIWPAPVVTAMEQQVDGDLTVGKPLSLFQ